MCPILLLLPAAAFSSHQESTEYSENLELVEVIQTGSQMWEADGVSLLQHALLWEMGVSMELTCVRGTWKHQLVTSPQCPLGTACRGGIAFLDLPVLPSCSPVWLLSPPELLHGSCSKMEKMMLQWKKVWGWTVILCSVKELWPLQCQVHVSSWLSCVVRKSSCPMIYLVT